jgi:hypothetical protein
MHKTDCFHVLLADILSPSAIDENAGRLQTELPEGEFSLHE